MEFLFYERIALSSSKPKLLDFKVNSKELMSEASLASQRAVYLGVSKLRRSPAYGDIANYLNNRSQKWYENPSHAFVAHLKPRVWALIDFTNDSTVHSTKDPEKGDWPGEKLGYRKVKQVVYLTLVPTLIQPKVL